MVSVLGALGAAAVPQGSPRYRAAAATAAAVAAATATAAASAHTQQCRFTFQQQRGLKFVHPRNWILEWKIRPGDKVMVISGTWRSAVGRVLQTDKMRNAVAVEGVKERLVRDSEGREVRVAGLIHVSNTMLIDPVTETPTRLALRRDEKGMPVRVSRRSGVIVPWPDPSLLASDNSRGSVEYLRSKKQQQQQQHGRQQQPQDEDTQPPGPKDTPKEKALEKTYDYAKEVATMDAIRLMMTKYNKDLR